MSSCFPVTIRGLALTSETLQHRAWQKDYFTSSLPWEQRGTPPALGLANTVDVSGKDEDITGYREGDATVRTLQFNAAQYVGLSTAPAGASDMRWTNPALEVDLTGATLDVSQIRLAFQIQRWMERNARAGARYTEFIRAHYGNGVAPRDERLDRAEYLGGSKSPLIITEIPQTSETNTTNQGNLAGKGITIDRKRICRYRVREHGIIMGIMSVMPKPKYYQVSIVTDV